MSDDIVTNVAPKKMTGLEHARAKRAANRAAAKKAAEATASADESFGGTITRQIKKAPIVPDDPAPEVAAARSETRQGARSRSDGRLEVVGHNGEVLSRTRVQVGDIFEIPKELIPPGWSYQWNAVSVAGNSDILIDQNHMMYQNGWRPVPAERYAGTLVPRGSKGNIIRGQQLLMERPTVLTQEARQEDIRNAKQLISDRNDALKLGGVKKNLGDGFEMSDKYKGTGGAVRMQIDKSLDVLDVNQKAGNYQLDE